MCQSIGALTLSNIVSGPDDWKWLVAVVMEGRKRSPLIPLDRTFRLGSGGAQRAIFVTPVTATAGRTWYFETMATILDVHEAIVRRMPPEEQRIVEEIIQEEMRRLRCVARRQRVLAELLSIFRRR